MGREKNIKVRKRRLLLIIELGGECVECGERDYKKLELDHIDPDTRYWHACGMDRLRRIQHYENDYQRRLLQLLCKTCHDDKSLKHKAAQAKQRQSNEPF